MFLSELTILSRFENYPQHICHFVGYDPGNMIILMRYYPRGHLLKLLISQSARTAWNRQVVLELCKDVADAVELLHKNDFAHCDLKSENVLLDFTPDRAGQMRAVLADFGLARSLSTQTQAVKSLKLQSLEGASMAYAAPELLLHVRARLSGALSADNRDAAALKISSVRRHRVLLSP